jgi:RNA polymerase-binding transcription factor DksA
MTKRTKRILEGRLRRDRALAERAIKSATPEPETDRSTTDRADLATIAIEKGTGQLLVSIESAAVTEIDKTLALLEARPDEYGVCEVCGKRIPAARLDVIPETRHCAAHSPKR